MLEVRDPADVRSVVAEVPAMTAADVAAARDRARAAFARWRRVSKEQGSAGIRFCTRIKTAATRFAW